MSRRGRGRGRGASKISTPLDDDIPLSSIFALLTPRRMARSRRGSPKKRPTRRRGARASNLRFQFPAPAPTPPTSTSEVISLDETPESSAMLSNVHSKMGDFMKSFISSDEEEAEMLKAKSNQRPAFNSIFVFDSDEETSGDLSKPSTSAGPSTDSKSHASNDDIMEIVDSVLDTTEFKNKENKPNTEEEMRSLEDYRKETEKLLQDASLLLDEFKTGRKQEPEKPAEDSPSKTPIGSCPICLESLSNRPASVTICGHIFCKECITKTVQTLKKCPTCRKPVTLKKIHPIFFN